MLSSTSQEILAEYPRGHALKSLLHVHFFDSVEAFAVACRNAHGDNLQTVPIVAAILVNDQCVDELLSVFVNGQCVEKNTKRHVQEALGADVSNKRPHVLFGV